MNAGFLHRPARIERIESVKSDTYPAIHSRHRGALYSGLLEKLTHGKNPPGSENRSQERNGFMFPHIL
jgi:hypothetical protein